MNKLARGWLALPIAFAIVSCAMTSGGSLSTSAGRLDRSAAEFHRSVASDSDAYGDDAQELAAEARDFRETLSEQGADDDDVRDAFNDLSRSYHAAREEVERRDDRDVERDFAEVTDAFLDLERAMSMSDDRRDRYASDDHEDDDA